MPSLTRDEAVERADLVRAVEYDLDLDLTEPGDGFGSTTVVRFSCQRPGARTFLELKPLLLHEVTLNGKALDPGALVENRFELTGLAGENEVIVRATMAYSNTGEGLHRFVDPEDGETYLYAQSALDDAQRLFACFDQPDLKAPVTLAVVAPPTWEVAANGAVARSSPGRWDFEVTQPLSTYLISVIAGPYHVRRFSHDGIAMALYCRRGLAKHLDADLDEIFGVTAACFDWYHSKFGVRYPFGKYDQAFVPEFNLGAMENAGLVTFRDEYVFRSAVTDSERQQRAEIIAHEMAHMWFGNLVTMRWWDDLWLNESFAEYMGYRVVADATRFTRAWIDFAVGRKGWGYADDQRPSTHPVAPELVPDVALALLNFDGISYAKGAAVLRQLAAWIGDEVFLAGLRDHFITHAFGNATLADLLGALSRASGRDLTGWADVWLRRAQVNTLRPEVSLGPDGHFASVDVIQTAPHEHPTLRPHRLGIGVYAGGALMERVEIDIDPTTDGRRTPVPTLAGVRRGEVLLLNDGDLTYAKIRFDPATRAALPRTLPHLGDPLARALVWAAMADAVRDAETPATEFVALCASALPGEAELTVFRDVVNFATRAVEQSLPRSAQPDAAATLASACLAALDRAEPGSGHQLVAARGYLASSGPSDVGRLAGWLKGTDVAAGLSIDAELRWSILNRLVVLGAAGASEIEMEYARDHTAAGAQHAARCRAARPESAAKAEAWRIIISDEVLSNRLVFATADGFWQPRQEDLVESYVERYFVEMPAMAARRTPTVVSYVAEAGFPRLAVTSETVRRAERLLERSDLTPALHRAVVDRTDELRRSLAGRVLVAGGSPDAPTP
jgi:aminopeptidase N